jgi:SAM-dependent methyltransferase
VLYDDWDSPYLAEAAPWDIGRPQAVWVRLADGGEITSPVLDAGCGTGDNALMLAERGMDVLGIDVAATAIARARDKARERNLHAEFVVRDVLALDQLGRTFATVVDSCFFHVLDDDQRIRYATSLASVLEPDGVLHLLCMSEHTPGDDGPRRVTQDELRSTFAEGWQIGRVDPARIDVKPDFPFEAPHAWLARIVRESGAVRPTESGTSHR